MKKPIAVHGKKERRAREVAQRRKELATKPDRPEFDPQAPHGERMNQLLRVVL